MIIHGRSDAVLNQVGFVSGRQRSTAKLQNSIRYSRAFASVKIGKAM